MAELSVYYCEQAADLSTFCGIDDDGYFTALLRMHGQALPLTSSRPAAEKANPLQRLDAVRAQFADVGWGVQDAMDELWLEHVDDAAPE